MGQSVAETHNRTTTATVREFLAQYRGARVHHPPLVDDRGELVGNNGDRLMVLGTEMVYADLGVRLVDDPREADLIVIGGSGGMLERFKWIRHAFRTMSQTYPDTPLCVLPSSFYFPTRPFGEEVGTRRAPVTLFCRERYSERHLLDDHVLPDVCEVGLDHDMAFELRESELVRALRGRAPEHVLIVERVDVEHNAVAMRPGAMRWRGKISRSMPKGLKRLLYPAVKRYRAVRATPFREQCEAIVRQRHPEFQGARRVVADVSNVNTATFEGFCDAIAGAGVVFTTRLHVGILASMLGRQTYIFEGPYHKIRGIYELSLSNLPHVTLVPKDAQPPEGSDARA